jgi:preprotein translocase subunit SecG
MELNQEKYMLINHNMQKLKIITATVLFSLLFINLNITTFAEEEETAVSCPTAPEDLSGAPEGTDLSACQGLPFTRPELADWEAANNPDRAEYCQQITCLVSKIRFANSGDIVSCQAAGVDPQSIQDSKCQSLRCENKKDKYYANSQDKLYDTASYGNNNCEVDKDAEKCNQALPAKINQCNVCKQRINQYISSNGGASAPTSERIGEESGINCQQYVGANCNTYFSCQSGSTPTANEKSTADNRPFGTEFFNVNDPTRGLNVQDQATGSFGQKNFTTSVEGGPLIGTINTVANFLVRMISVLALIVFIIGAFLLIIANGEENQINRGKDAIKLSLAGIVIVMLSYTIVVLVQSIFF